MKREFKETETGPVLTAVMTIRHDDSCGNGHNTFAITCEVYKGRRWESGGCQHDLIRKVFPEYGDFIKYHLVSTDGPMYYIENTKYHAKQRKIRFARKTAIWPDASKEELLNEELLNARLPFVMGQFKGAVESLGLTY